MRVSQVLDLCTHPIVHFGRLELGKQLVHRQGLILLYSRMASNFSLYTVRSRECKSLIALSWSSYGSTPTLALMLFIITVNR
jgi:hypothetical protein